jgi:hypothetical protein
MEGRRSGSNVGIPLCQGRQGTRDSLLEQDGGAPLKAASLRRQSIAKGLWNRTCL